MRNSLFPHKEKLNGYITLKLNKKHFDPIGISRRPQALLIGSVGFAGYAGAAASPRVLWLLSECMAQIVCPLVSAEDRARLEALVADRNRAQKHVLRARLILASADRLNVAEVARRAGVGRPAMWRWQRRLALPGLTASCRTPPADPARRP
jgi:hypothetical protein